MSANADIYGEFAKRYDLEPNSLDKNNPLVVRFFRQLFLENGVQVVVDCACGTGRHLLLFDSLGCEVWGSDVSPAMLDQARRNLARFGAAAPLQQADYRDLPDHFERKFDAVICLGSIGYMPDEEQFLRAFGSMRAVLREGGILILTVMPTDKQWREKPRFEVIVNTVDVTRLFVMDYLERTVRYNILDIFHGPAANELKVWSAELTVLLWNEQERLLKATGFRQVDFWGSFEFDPYDKGRSERLITIARN